MQGLIIGLYTLFIVGLLTFIKNKLNLTYAVIAGLVINNATLFMILYYLILRFN